MQTLKKMINVRVQLRKNDVIQLRNIFTHINYKNGYGFSNKNVAYKYNIAHFAKQLFDKSFSLVTKPGNNKVLLSVNINVANSIMEMYKSVDLKNLLLDLDIIILQDLVGQLDKQLLNLHTI